MYKDICAKGNVVTLFENCQCLHFVRVDCYNFADVQTDCDKQIQPLRVFLALQMQVTNQQDL